MANSVDSSRTCKRVTVVLCAMVHVVVTVYVLSLLVESSSQGSTPLPDCLKSLNPYRIQKAKPTTKDEEYRKALIELRRQAAPLVLILRIKDIEAELAMADQEKNEIQAAKNIEKDEKDELEDQKELETGQRPPAVVDDPIGRIQRTLTPEKCQPELKTDFGGVAVRWGLTHHVNSAADCCKACSQQAAYAKSSQRKCNVWVFCPEKKGCSSPDGYEHKFGECWLKHADKPRGIVNDYSLIMRNKTAPPMPVLWMSGVIPFNGE